MHLLFPAALMLVCPPGPLAASPQSQVLTAAPTQFQAEYGHSLAISGNTLVVGAPKEDLGSSKGAVYVYERSGGVWGLQAKLSAPFTQVFGYTVSISGNRIAVGGTSSVYIFERSESVWSQSALVPSPGGSNNGFGAQLELDGDRLIAGAPSQGSGDGGRVYVLELQGGSWVLVATLKGSDTGTLDHFGRLLDVDGDRLVAGADKNGGGVFYVFEYDGAAWTETDRFVPSVQPGSQGEALLLEGDLLWLGTPNMASQMGGLFAFVNSPGGWGETAFFPAPTGGRHFGASLASEGELLLVGEFGTGGGCCVWMMDGDGGAPSLMGSLPGGLLQNNGPGAAVVLDGDEAVVGAPNSEVGPLLGVTPVVGLAVHPASGQMYGTNTRDLYEIDGPMAGSLVGATGFIGLQSLTFDPSAQRFLSVDTDQDLLVSLNPLTGAGTAIGPVGFDEVVGLALDTVTGTLYAVDQSSNQLLTIDRTTGAGSAVAPLPFPHVVSSLACDPGAGKLYSVSLLASQTIEIDPAKAQVTVLGSSGSAQMECLAWDPFAGDLVGVDATQYSPLFRIDAVTGTGTELGALVEPRTGAVGVYPMNQAFTYCTAGTSASGCTASLSAAGSASASAASGFQLAATEVQGAVQGLFFFGSNGRQASPWGNGSSTQCVLPPVVRAVLMTGSGAHQTCEGSFSEDLNALWCPGCPKPGKNPGAGAVVQAQLWYRDPQSTSNQTTSLSDAIEFFVGP